jgi:hypothetical protein
MRAVGEFYDHRDTDGFGRVYQVHRRSIMPAMRVCREWGSFLLDEKTIVACENQQCTDWIGSFFSSSNFWGRAQETVARAFGLGTGTFVAWMDMGRKIVKVRRYDAHMVVPLSWDSESVRECAFVMRVFLNGEGIDRLQMHVIGDDSAYRVRTICFDRDGRVVSVPDAADEVATGCSSPTFGTVRPAVTNTRVDFSPYGQSIFADAVDAVQSVDLAYDALINEIDAGKMRVFLSDVIVRPGEDKRRQEDTYPLQHGRLHGFSQGDEHRGHDHRVRAGSPHRGTGEGISLGLTGLGGSRGAGRELLRHGQRRLRQDGYQGLVGQQRTHEEHQKEREHASECSRGHLQGRYGLQQVHGR